MRAFIAICIVIVLAAAVPVTCPHALTGTGPALAQSHGGHTMPASAHHPDGHGTAAHDTDTDRHAPAGPMPCADECDGGPGCSGCFTVTGLTGSEPAQGRIRATRPVQPWGAEVHSGLAASFDPPPPRA